ncbi:MAG: ArsR family transcriptional regulator [Deltaproteobacteria bacterium]|nr:ArsR family transcriptional regulator [Deltaproteobacteria bacterium]TLN01907.1 MAG: winged helix-turn-helix transcriptional regulator [bacterium]
MGELTVARAEILKAIAQPTRMKIIEFLREGERCVCEIFPAIDEEQSNTSRHLNMMQGCGILARRKEGIKIMYRLKHSEVLEILDLVSVILKKEISSKNDLLKAV